MNRRDLLKWVPTLLGLNIVFPTVLRAAGFHREAMEVASLTLPTRTFTTPIQDRIKEFLAAVRSEFKPVLCRNIINRYPIGYEGFARDYAKIAKRFFTRVENPIMTWDAVKNEYALRVEISDEPEINATLIVEYAVQA